MKLTKAQIEEAIVTIFSKLTQGQTDIEIADEMGMSMEEYLNIKRAMFEVKAEEARTKPREHVYIEYMIDQLQNIRALDEIVAKFEETNQYTAIVGAIRTRSELLKNILQQGQEFGIIHKEPEKKQIVAGVAITQLTNEKLKKLIFGEVRELNKMSKRFLDKDITQIETPEELYFEGSDSDDDILQVEGEATVVHKEKDKPKKKEKIKKKKTKEVRVINSKKKKKEKQKTSRALSPLEAAEKEIDG